MITNKEGAYQNKALRWTGRGMKILGVSTIVNKVTGRNVSGQASRIQADGKIKSAGSKKAKQEKFLKETFGGDKKPDSPKPEEKEGGNDSSEK
jgi:hypothetical protein